MNKRHTSTAFFAIAAALLLSPFTSLVAQEQTAPAIELGSPFRDNAILQREKDVPVWGWSKPGTSVTVEFARQKDPRVSESLPSSSAPLRKTRSSRRAVDFYEDSERI